MQNIEKSQQNIATKQPARASSNNIYNTCRNKQSIIEHFTSAEHNAQNSIITVRLLIR